MSVCRAGQALQERFGLREVVLVGDRGMLRAANARAPDEMGLKEVMALRSRKHAHVRAVVAEARSLGPAFPRDRAAAWTVQEVKPRQGVRCVVVYSAYRGEHDRPVRAKRVRDALARLARLEQQVEGRAARWLDWPGWSNRWKVFGWGIPGNSPHASGWCCATTMPLVWSSGRSSTAGCATAWTQPRTLSNAIWTASFCR